MYLVFLVLMNIVMKLFCWISVWGFCLVQISNGEYALPILDWWCHIHFECGPWIAPTLIAMTCMNPGNDCPLMDNCLVCPTGRRETASVKRACSATDCRSPGRTRSAWPDSRQCRPYRHSVPVQLHSQELHSLRLVSQSRDSVLQSGLCWYRIVPIRCTVPLVIYGCGFTWCLSFRACS